ncbi:hypothetical protein [uncultured Algibacter sp.]|uniref:hypothetical protein n=1 Tax=uncultured Algibacter sp. TaxID=298659 RepID=UPI003216F301
MKKNLNFLLGKEVINLFSLVIVEDDDKFELDDTYIFELNNDIFVQILIDYNKLELFLINKELTDVKIAGDFDSNSEKKLKEKEKGINLKITSIESFVVKSSNLLIGSSFLNSKSEFLFALSYGFDEIEFIYEEDEFLKMIKSFSDIDDLKSEINTNR